MGGLTWVHDPEGYDDEYQCSFDEACEREGQWRCLEDGRRACNEHLPLIEGDEDD